MIPEIRKKQAELENEYITKSHTVDSIATKLYKQDPEKCEAMLTDNSVEFGNNTVQEWKKLYYYLFTRYMDGNVKTKIEEKKLPELEQPGYNEEWYKMVIEKTGDKFKVPEN